MRDSAYEESARASTADDSSSISTDNKRSEEELQEEDNAGAGSTVVVNEATRADEEIEPASENNRLRAENTRLRDELSDANEELETLRTFVNSELPQFKIIAVQARAELECVKSQLHDERAHRDRLEAQVAHYKARSNVHVPTPAARPLQGNNTRRSNKSTEFEGYKNAQSHNKRDDSRRRERENFLLQCRLSAVRSDSEDKENSDCGGNMGDSISDAEEKATSPPDAEERLPSPSAPVASSSSRSRASLSSSKLLSSSRVHRDLSVLDNELHALHQALREIPHSAPVPRNGAKSKRKTI